MSVFKEMDPEVALAAIEGYEDILTPEATKLDEFYATFTCPRCKCGLQKEFDTRTAFDGGGAIARSLLRCSTCFYLVEPHTNLCIEVGDAAKTATPEYGFELID